MKWAFVGMLSALVVLYIGWLLLWPSDVVTSRYESVDDARTDELFERGWLPDILPPSSGGIRTSNHLDFNTSDGEFYFHSSEYVAFAARLRPYKTIDTPFSNFEAEVAEMRARGFQPAIFEDEASTWVFFCKPEGHCEYRMWLRRG